MINILRNLVICISLVALAGCTVIPGGHVDVGLLVEEESFDIYPQINVRLINPTLLSELQLSEPVAKTNKAPKIAARTPADKKAMANGTPAPTSSAEV